MARGALKKLRERGSIRAATTARMFLGLDGIAVKSHGGTDAFGFAYAIGVARRPEACTDFSEKIVDELARLNAVRRRAGPWRGHRVA